MGGSFLGHNKAKRIIYSCRPTLMVKNYDKHCHFLDKCFFFWEFSYRNIRPFFFHVFLRKLGSDRLISIHLAVSLMGFFVLFHFLLLQKVVLFSSLKIVGSNQKNNSGFSLYL